MHRFPPRTQSRSAIAAALCALLVGCGEDPKTAPAGCTEGDGPLLAALRSAPRQVRVGSVRLSECLIKGATGDQLQLVGTSFVQAASRLSDRAREQPEGRAALELGYLVAAAHRGGRATQGVHDELLRRLDQEAAAVGTRSRAYRRGARAGRAGG